MTKEKLAGEEMVGRRSTVAALLTAALLGGGFFWWRHAQKGHDRAVVAAFVVAARQGQEAKPCAVAVEKVAELSRRTRDAVAPACVAKADPDQARRFSEVYVEIAKTCDGIAGEVSKFDLRSSTVIAAATNLRDLNDPDLKRVASDAQAAVAKREQVTTALLADWRTLSKASTGYAKRLTAGLGQGDKDACAGLERGLAAKSPAEILVNCNNSFDAQRAAVDASLTALEQLVQR
jgi:hypothetical protein